MEFAALIKRIADVITHVGRLAVLINAGYVEEMVQAAIAYGHLVGQIIQM